ncbi:serine protease [Vibrio sp. T187]|uniref:S1 family peptidase n=1 Tax=Vibrio TaxID=662 RepID=UPI0010C9A8B8|nr:MULTISPECIES: serine protease [Vibrio]MBW3696207.1 serine protease [Vibrio sp. T187]
MPKFENVTRKVRLAIKELCVPVILFTSCVSYAEVEISPYIVNGSTSSVATFPSIAHLFIDSLEYDNVYYSQPYCGATILDEDHILTAAHCIYGDTVVQLFTTVVPQLFNVNDYPFGNIQRVRVSEIYYRNDFSNDLSDLLANDIAILKLESSLNIDTVNDVIERPTSESYRSDNVNTTFTAVGHGNTSSGNDTSDVLRQVNLTPISNSSCAAMFIEGASLTNNQICFDGAYSSSTGLSGGTCQGDSGGPVYWYDGSQYVQIGLTSFGPSQCGYNGGVTSVFTEIYDYSAWVDSVLAGNETPKVTSTNSQRQSYLNSNGQITYSGGGTISGNGSSSQSGGSVPFLSITLLLIAAATRKWARSWRRVRTALSY